jgi:hypothetical protein
MEGFEVESIPHDMPECEEAIRDETGHILSRHKDYWAWHEAVKKQLFQDT